MPLTRYRLRFRAFDGAAALESLRGQYLGAVWRGVFGAVLRDAVCVTRQPVCDGCALLRSCPYPFLFESRPPPGAAKFTRYPRTPGPYVLAPETIETKRLGATMHLGLTLFGSANDQLPYIVYALERAGRTGIAKRRIKLELLDVEAENPATSRQSSPMHKGSAAAENAQAPGVGWSTVSWPGRELEPAPAFVPQAGELPGALRVRMLSPLRLRRENKPVRENDLNFPIFLSALLRRISMLTYFFSPTPLETDFADLTRKAAQVEISGRDVRWRELTRYSSRQRAEIPMGGLTGEFRLEADGLALFWPYLWLGQWTHVGRGCTMGLGRYALALADDGSGISNGPMWLSETAD